ncbi:hypothetical protein KQX54_013886 [Cotesia glomerata]|uniref:Uncharacterized protein n=1 Tax=Cotesia glomerata TaxID=32391 RepID=A0AAV7IN54_COTGL|nr:hypothetical protein KQX54_013886 [Cotesia glomerata]
MANSATISYSNVMQTTVFPTKEQAILLDGIDGIPIKEYVKNILRLVPSENIRIVSRILGNRICMYLASKELAEKSVNENKTVKINEIPVRIRPLITQNKRIIISNVPPIIPHAFLVDVLKGHQAKVCYLNSKNAENDDDLTHDNNINTIDNPNVNDTSNNMQMDLTIPQTQIEQADRQTSNLNNKRPHSMTTTSSERQIDNISEDLETNLVKCEFKSPAQIDRSKHRKKLIKAASKDSDHQEKNSKDLELLRNIIETNPNRYKVSFLEFKNFIERTIGSRNISVLVNEFTTDAKHLASILEELYPYLTTRSMKNRFTRIKNLIKFDLTNTNFYDSLSNTSESEDN